MHRVNFGRGTQKVPKPSTTITPPRCSGTRLAVGFNLPVQKRRGQGATIRMCPLVILMVAGAILSNCAANPLHHLLIYTKLLKSGETDTVIFATPAEAGEYTYLCTFPGHYLMGMKGTLVVEP